MPDPEKRLRFFISRAGEDARWARWISNVLEAEGHTTELQDFDFKPGDSIPHRMKLALERADHVIALLSPHYMAKKLTLAELYAAFFADPNAERRFVIPVLVERHDRSPLFDQFVYISFVEKDDATCKQLLLDGIREERLVRQEPFPGAGPSAAPRTFIRKLPTVDPHVFGRDREDRWLEQAWTNPETNFVQVIAPGGAGKTALITAWYRNHLKDVTVFGWSFYSQGTREKSQTSSDPFFAEALPFFGIAAPASESIFTELDRLVDRLRQERVLLILHGTEPLQDPEGGLRDLAMKALVQELAARNAGMVLCTTRLRLTDVPDEESRALSRDLNNLDPDDGARYLRFLGVRGPQGELCEASEAYGNHALALTLLGTYLVTFRESDIRHWPDIRELQDEEIGPGRHARKVMGSYAKMYHGRPELDVLRGLGYFDRPAEPEALRLVLPPIKDHKYRAALKRLRDARLILTADPAQPLDCHPLIREYFARDATQKGHSRLYEHYKGLAVCGNSPENM
ncbi:MAG TPA: toll/interleukin-1 receptor domain-containing protein [Bryobacteraceae bacterium]|nr:toll/interleukin-1 receptor domain-containing protein [Bryobacteraceae bacterium]